MRQISSGLLRRMAEALHDDVRDEMAIPSYLHLNPLIRWMAWHRVHLVARALRQICVGRFDRSSCVIMDYGCGTGVLLGEASHCAETVYGVDLHLQPATMLVNEWRLGNVQLLSNVEFQRALPYRSLDLIVAAEVLEHVQELHECLALFRSRLQPEGRLLVSLPTESMFYRFGRRLAGFHGHYHVSNAASIHHEILAAGFQAANLKKTPGPGPLAIYWIVEYTLRI